MPGTRRGGLKAAKTMKNRYGRDHFKRIGRMGGNPQITPKKRKP